MSTMKKEQEGVSEASALVHFQVHLAGLYRIQLPLPVALNSVARIWVLSDFRLVSVLINNIQYLCYFFHSLIDNCVAEKFLPKVEWIMIYRYSGYMHQPSEVGIMHQLSQKELRASGKKCHAHFFLQKRDTSVKTGTLGSCCLAPALSQALRASCWIWGEQQRMSSYLCVSVAPEARQWPHQGETFLLRLFSSNRNSFILSSSLGWNEMTGNVGCFNMYFMCIWREEGRSCASSRWKALLFPCAALITIDLYLQLWDHSPTTSAVCSSQLLLRQGP